MKKITHNEQRERWEKEHEKPSVLLQMDANDASSGVIKFVDWLTDRGVDLNGLSGLEMCCGKGRNVIWLAQQSVNATGLDFSSFAINEAKRRAKKVGVKNAKFLVQDVTLPWAVDAETQDFAIDCFGSTDIESADGRRAARDNIIRVLKPGGYLIVYLLSTDDTFQKEMREANPGPDDGSFLHPTTGKYEKQFTEAEVMEFYQDLTLLELCRVPKQATFFGKEYDCNHIWAVFQKPKNGR
jgi:ubiquinone/menaquinone biosynthesis C-methylase UbiE